MVADQIAVAFVFSIVAALHPKTAEIGHIGSED